MYQGYLEVDLGNDMALDPSFLQVYGDHYDATFGEILDDFVTKESWDDHTDVRPSLDRYHTKLSSIFLKCV